MSSLTDIFANPRIAIMLRWLLLLKWEFLLEKYTN